MQIMLKRENSLTTICKLNTYLATILHIGITDAIESLTFDVNLIGILEKKFYINI
jgi:hypothetical protein